MALAFKTFFRSPQSRARDRRWWAMVTLIIIALIGTGEGLRALGRHYRIAVDLQEQACLPSRVSVVKLAVPDQIERGDVLAFRTALASPYVTASTVMGKRVAGLPGDRVTIKQLELFVNGTHRGQLALCRQKYVERFCADREVTIREGEVFMLTEHETSFDSRYWGPIARSDIIGQIVWPNLAMGER